jgi:Gas vesicle synthesis protein GvpL/GvpF
VAGRVASRRDDLLWAYGIARAADPLPVGRPGVGDGPCLRVAEGGLALLASRVPRGEYDRDRLHENLNDLGWLERTARAHEEVLDEAVSRTTIVPLRLCTLFESEQRIRRVLVRERDRLERTLDVLAGRSEWAVKVLADPARTAEAVGAAVPLDGAGCGEGQAYLRRRKHERATREAADAWAGSVSDDIDARLRSEAVAAVAHPAQNRALAGYSGEMVLNAAYLVDADNTDRLRELVDELNAAHRGVGLAIGLSGPWPPYNFVPDALR